MEASRREDRVGLEANTNVQVLNNIFSSMSKVTIY